MFIRFPAIYWLKQLIRIFLNYAQGILHSDLE